MSILDPKEDSSVGADKPINGSRGIIAYLNVAPKYELERMRDSLSWMLTKLELTQKNTKTMKEVEASLELLETKIKEAELRDLLLMEKEWKDVSEDIPF